MTKKIFLFLCMIVVSQLKAQEVQIINFDGLKNLLSPQDDVTYVVNFWATWCRPCIEELPEFEKVNREYDSEKLKVILVAVEDDLEKVRNFIAKKGIQSEVKLLEEPNANKWIPVVDKDWEGEIPVTLVLNHQKNKRSFHLGKLTEEELKKMIEESAKLESVKD